MKIKNLLLLAFMFGMIAITIFLSSSPFSILQPYTCTNATIQDKTSKVCLPSDRVDELPNAIAVLQTAPLSNGTQSNALSIIKSGDICHYSSDTTCLGETTTYNGIIGTKYIVKQSYAYDTLPCSQSQPISFYYTDCSTQNATCLSGRCVKYKYQVNFNSIMRGIGFKP